MFLVDKPLTYFVNIFLLSTKSLDFCITAYYIIIDSLKQIIDNNEYPVVPFGSLSDNLRGTVLSYGTIGYFAF